MTLKFTKILLYASCLLAGQAVAQKFEAETATLKPDTGANPAPAIVVACDTCSGGQVVDTKSTGFTLPLTVAKEGKYNVYIKAASPHGQKTITLKLGSLSSDVTLPLNPAYLKVKVMSNVKLTAGTVPFEMIRNWGYVFIDYIELEEITPVASSKLEAEDGTLIPAASNGASLLTCATCSGGAGVETKETGFTIEALIPKDANYNIYLYVASPHDAKTNTFTIDKGLADAVSVTFDTPKDPNYIKLKVVANQKLTKGTHILSIEKDYGWINVDYIEMEEAAPPLFNITDTLVTKNASLEAKCLYKFLKESYGKKIISGVMTLNIFEETDWLKTNTGKEPGLMGLDFMHDNRGYTWYDNQANLNAAKAWTAKNGIVTMLWHWRDPLRNTEGFYKPVPDKPDSIETNFDVSKIHDPNSAEYIAMLKDIDSISLRLKEFEANKIPVLWRPLHEAAGAWFWWGAKTGADLKKLWVVMYDRMVHHHGLTNLIWVWTNNGNDQDWYPGDQYVDIVGVDIYNVNGDHGSQVSRFYSLNEAYAGKKMLALTEVEATPDVDNLVADEAYWSWYMPWYKEYAINDLAKYTSKALWQKMFASDYVLTVDEMPKIDASCGAVAVDDITLDQATLSAYPTEVQDAFKLSASQEIYTVSIYNGMGVLVKQLVANANEVSVDFADQKSGMYLVTINNNKTVKVFKK